MRYLIAVVALSLSDVARAQTPQIIRLGKPEVTLSRPFSCIAAIRELGDGRVVIIDDREVEVVVADLRAQSTTPLGRRGQGPREYLRPSGLIPLPNGRTLLQDPGNARFLELDSAGTIVGSNAPRLASSDKEVDATLSLIMAWDVRGSDEMGRLFFEHVPGQRDIRSGQVLSVPIVRWDPQRQALDTVTTYQLGEEMLSLTVRAGGPREVLVRPRAWVPRTQWVVAPNGRVAFAEPNPYRVIWADASGRREGPVVSFTARSVTEVDRESYLEELDAAQARSRSSRRATPPAPRPSGAPPPTRKRGGEPIFPAEFPSFVGRDAVRIDPVSHVWIARAGSVSDTTSTYDIFDEAGRRQRQAQLPRRSRLVGFGAHAIYVARRDADDLEYLERYGR